MANFCTNCGATLEETFKFCAKCGTPVSSTTEQNKGNNTVTTNLNQEREQKKNEMDIIKEIVEKFKERDKICGELLKYKREYSKWDPTKYVRAGVRNQPRTLGRVNSEKKTKKLEELSEAIKIKEAEINEIDIQMEPLYSQCERIPQKYRKSEAINFIYEYMLSSNSDIEEAIVEYDQQKKEERQNKREEKSRRRRNEWEKEVEARERRYEEERYRAEREESSSGGGFLQGIAEAAIGGAIANHGIKKELKQMREEAEEREYKQKMEKFYEEQKQRDKESQLRAQAHSEAVSGGGSVSEQQMREVQILNRMGLTQR